MTFAEQFDERVARKLAEDQICHFCDSPPSSVTLIETKAESGDPMDDLIQLVSVCDEHR